MKVLLVCVGSRGDTEPFCSLSSCLVSNGHEVDFFIQADVQHLAPTHPSIRCHELPFRSLDFYKYVANPSHGQDHENPRVRFLGIVTDCIGELVLPCTKSVLDVAVESRPDFILATSLARQLAMAVGDKVGCNIGWVQLQPLMPTKDFAHYSKQEESVDALLVMHQEKRATVDDENGRKNFESYIELERYQHEFLHERVEALYADLGLGEQPSFEDDIQSALCGERDNVIMINGFSNQIFPQCSDHASKTVLHPGALADAYIPNNWQAPGHLTTFLAACDEAPVCIGFGSMPFAQKQELLAALRKLKRRVVLVGPAILLDGMNDNICHVETVPYAWLLPQCSMMLSHGGAGVMHATLRAGIPAVIAPMLGDQFLNARLLQRLGWGVQCGNNLGTVTCDEILASIGKASRCEDACQRLGLRMQTGGIGAEHLVRLLTEHIANKS